MKQEFPDYKMIMSVCRGKMIRKFPKYVNSWKKYDSDYFYQKINIDAVPLGSLNNNFNVDKLINIINYCCMALERMK